MAAPLSPRPVLCRVLTGAIPVEFALQPSSAISTRPAAKPASALARPRLLPTYTFPWRDREPCRPKAVASGALHPGQIDFRSRRLARTHRAGARPGLRCCKARRCASRHVLWRERHRSRGCPAPQRRPHDDIVVAACPLSHYPRRHDRLPRRAGPISAELDKFLHMPRQRIRAR